jgi:maltose O-acetyltransferase
MKYLALNYLGRILGKISDIYWILIYSKYRYLYCIDNTFKFNGVLIKFYGDGSINAGANSYIGELSTLQASKDYSINIGKFCSISHNVRVYTQSNLPDCDFSLQEHPQKYGNVTFENYCWVGANVFVCPGVTIGENSVIGANSVVTKNVPSFEIWGGVPAKLIRKKNISA